MWEIVFWMAVLGILAGCAIVFFSDYYTYLVLQRKLREERKRRYILEEM